MRFLLLAIVTEKVAAPRLGGGSLMPPAEPLKHNGQDRLPEFNVTGN